MRRSFIFTLSLFIVSLCFYACQHKAENVQPVVKNGGNNGNTNGSNTPDTSLCFERDVLPIFISNCAKGGCHDAASHQDGFVFISWATITSKKFVAGNANATELYEKITEDKPDKIMPPLPSSPLTLQQIAIIKDWINRGAPNTTGCNSGCDSTKFTFSGTIQPMLNNYCKGCHNANLSSGGFSYEDYNGVVTAVNSGRFLGAIKQQVGYSPMPKGGNKISDCQILQIEKWIASGMQNN